jgi:hypothetical protein
MKSSLDFCPVPEEQQPVNEYEQLKESWFFRWATLDVASYTKKFLWLWLWTWVLVGPIAAASFPLKKAPFLFFCAGIFGSTILVGLVLLRLYLGWIYVYDRLQSEKVFYEESGWYDGQIWTKTAAILTRDRLIVSYQIQPILRRLQKTALILGAIVAISGLFWLFFTH